MCEAHHDLDTSFTGKAPIPTTNHDRDRSTTLDQPDQVDQADTLAIATQMASLSLGGSQAALLEVGSDNSNGQGVAMNSSSNVAHSSTVGANSSGEGWITVRSPYRLRSASLTDASTSLSSAHSSPIPSSSQAASSSSIVAGSSQAPLPPGIAAVIPSNVSNFITVPHIGTNPSNGLREVLRDFDSIDREITQGRNEDYSRVWEKVNAQIRKGSGSRIEPRHLQRYLIKAIEEQSSDGEIQELLGKFDELGFSVLDRYDIPGLRKRIKKLIASRNVADITDNPADLGTQSSWGIYSLDASRIFPDSSVLSTTIKTQSQTSQRFTLFPELPPELRHLIWHHHIRGTIRIIEIENIEKEMVTEKLLHIQDLMDHGRFTGPTENRLEWLLSRHFWRRVCPKSGRPPAVMSVNHESRTEGEKYYEKRIFDTNEFSQPDDKDSPLNGHEVYFNPNTDILYFGENCCASTLRNLFNPRDETVCQPIYHVALCESVWKEVYDRTDEAYWYGDGYACCSYLNDFECSLPGLQVLHGIDPEKNRKYSTARMFRHGCPGLKTVRYIVPSKLGAIAPGEMSDQVGLRPATSCGLTPHQRGHRMRFENMVDDVLSGGKPYFWFNGNRWDGANKPSFHFNSFCPLVLSDEKVYDSLAIEPRGIELLSDRNALFIKELRHGCIIKPWLPTVVPPYWAPKDDQWELDFEGPKAGVERAKNEIKRILEEGGVRWVKTNQEGSEFCALGWDQSGYDKDRFTSRSFIKESTDTE